MKRQFKKICRWIIQRKGFRHISYFFIEVGFYSAKFLLNTFNGPRLHQENPWKDRSFKNTLHKGKCTEDCKAWVSYCRFLRDHLKSYFSQPKISILMPVYRPKLCFLEEAIESVLLQSYENLELCIVDYGSESIEIDTTLKKYCRNNSSKIKYLKHTKNNNVSAATNSCFSLATGSYITLLEHDDRLKPNALAELVRAIVLNDNPDVLYSDEEIIDDEGIVQSTVHKPGWSEFFHLSKNYTTHLSAYKSSLIKQIGGWRSEMEGAHNHDLMLRAVEETEESIAHIPISLYQLRAHESGTAQNGDAKQSAAIAGVNAVTSACARRGFPAKVEFEAKYFQYKISPALPTKLPIISIIIPNKDSFEYISVCLSSIFNDTQYSRFEVIVVDNGSTNERCFQLYSHYENLYPGMFSIISDNRYFNFARLNNNGARQAEGEYLVFLNSDTEVLQQDWLEGLLGFAQIDKIGAVGCKLFYGNGPIQHAGIYGAGRDVGGHSGRLLSGEATLPLSTNNCLHDCMGITAACLMISKEKFWQAGGFEETHVPNQFGDVLLGISLQRLGFVNLFTPYVHLKHYESISRGKYIEMYERFYLCKTFPANLLMDKYYNLNYSYNDHYIVDENYRVPELPHDWIGAPFYK